MPRIKYLIQCDSVKQENGKYNALGIFDTIYSFVFPTVHEHFSLLLGVVDADPGKYDLLIYLYTPSEKQLAEIKGTFNITSKLQTLKYVINLDKCPLPEEGEYRISVMIQGDVVCEYKFRALSPVKRNRELTEEELKKVLNNEDYVQSANAAIECPQCHQRWQFQSNLDKKALPNKGFLPFPPGGRFHCTCGKDMDLRATQHNIEQLLGLPKNLIQDLQKGKENK